LGGELLAGGGVDPDAGRGLEPGRSRGPARRPEASGPADPLRPEIEVPLVVDPQQADAEGAMIEIRRVRPRGAVGQGEGRLARAGNAVHAREMLDLRGVAQ